MNRYKIFSIFVAALALLFIESGCATPPGSQTHTPATEEAVAILIVDDFGYNVPKEIPNLQVDDCVVHPDGQGHYSGGGAGNCGNDPHGKCVLEEARAQLDALGITSSTAVTSGLQGLGPVETFVTQTDSILLVPVDTERYTTKVISDRIQGTLDWLSRDRGIDKAVINMSFAVIPCDPFRALNPEQIQNTTDQYLKIIDNPENKLQELKATFSQLDLTDPEARKSLFYTADEFAPLRANKDFAQTTLAAAYMNLQQNQSNENFYSTWTKGKLSSQTDSNDWDALAGYFNTTLGNNQNIINIAAAGNLAKLLGNAPPLAPALWDDVISVSASQADGTKADYSNNGEVMLGGTTLTGQHEGTSFAAPKLSVLAALYLLQGGQKTCTGSVNSTNPPMKYAPLTHSWDNLAVNDAASQYCTVFPHN